MGGDDFLAKPFDLNVAIAKIAARLRRTYDFGAGCKRTGLAAVRCWIPKDAFAATLQQPEAGADENESSAFCNAFCSRRGRTVPREDIMQALWESDSFIDDNTLTVNVARLRAHLAEIGLEDHPHTEGLSYLVDETTAHGSFCLYFSATAAVCPKGSAGGGWAQLYAVRGDHSVPRAESALYTRQPCRRWSRVLFFLLCLVLPPACRGRGMSAAQCATKLQAEHALRTPGYFWRKTMAISLPLWSANCLLAGADAAHREADATEYYTPVPPDQNPAGGHAPSGRRKARISYS